MRSISYMYEYERQSAAVVARSTANTNTACSISVSRRCVSFNLFNDQLQQYTAVRTTVEVLRALRAWDAGSGSQAHQLLPGCVWVTAVLL